MMSFGRRAVSSWVTRRPISAGTIVLALAVICALALALPGQTVATRYLKDLFLLLDQAYRIGCGQVPGRDFHSPLGPLASYVPWAGYAISGSLGAPSAAISPSRV